MKTIQDLKQNTISASREARLCHVSEMPESCNLSPETKLSIRVSKYEIRNVNNQAKTHHWDVKGRRDLFVQMCMYIYYV